VGNTIIPYRSFTTYSKYLFGRDSENSLYRDFYLISLIPKKTLSGIVDFVVLIIVHITMFGDFRYMGLIPSLYLDFMCH